MLTRRRRTTPTPRGRCGGPPAPRGRRRDQGQLTLLVVGYTLVAAVLVTAGVDASKVFLARRALASAADAAALTAAQAVDRAAVYSGSGCAGLLPLDDRRAVARVDAAIDDDVDLRRGLAALDPPRTTVDSGTVTVRLRGEVALPFGRVLAVLVPSLTGGRAPVAATAHAQAPLAVPGGCTARG